MAKASKNKEVLNIRMFPNFAEKNRNHFLALEICHVTHLKKSLVGQ